MTYPIKIDVEDLYRGMDLMHDSEIMISYILFDYGNRRLSLDIRIFLSAKARRYVKKVNKEYIRKLEEQRILIDNGEPFARVNEYLRQVSSNYDQYPIINFTRNLGILEYARVHLILED